VIVLGRINISLDVFATKTEFAALTSAVQALEARVSALENQ
jgi:polyhydroxyalkanoate synthesis regulator phasin